MIKPSISKETASHEISVPISSLYNISIEQGISPNEVKIAEFVPAFESGDKESFIAY